MNLPIAIGFGAGAESRRPLGLAVRGGLVVSQLLDSVHHPRSLLLHGQVPAEGEQPDWQAQENQRI